MVIYRYWSKCKVKKKGWKLLKSEKLNARSELENKNMNIMKLNWSKEKRIYEIQVKVNWIEQFLIEQKRGGNGLFLYPFELIWINWIK
jgi:hypothetical protein